MMRPHHLMSQELEAGSTFFHADMSSEAGPQGAPITFLSTASPSFQIGAKSRSARFSQEPARQMRPRMIFPAVSPKQTDQDSPVSAQSGQSTQSANARC